MESWNLSTCFLKFAVIYALWYMIFHKFLFLGVWLKNFHETLTPYRSQESEGFSMWSTVKRHWSFEGFTTANSKAFEASDPSAVDVSEKCWFFQMMICHGSFKDWCLCSPSLKKWRNTISKVFLFDFFSGTFLERIWERIDLQKLTKWSFMVWQKDLVMAFPPTNLGTRNCSQLSNSRKYRSTGITWWWLLLGSIPMLIHMYYW